MSKKVFLLLSLVTVLFTACTSKKDISPALSVITPESMKNYIAALASDDFEGRAPATKGEEKTINYLAGQFKSLGLEPANKDSYFQEVALVRIEADPKMQMSFSGGKNKFSLNYSDDFIAGTPKAAEEIKVDNSDIIFAGYGIVAPEYGWNDYAGIDVKGKTVIVLVNDPGMQQTTPLCSQERR